jgi:hypothetical protein
LTDGEPHHSLPSGWCIELAFAGRAEQFAAKRRTKGRFIADPIPQQNAIDIFLPAFQEQQWQARKQA